jgi:hypothetical protein
MFWGLRGDSEGEASSMLACWYGVKQRYDARTAVSCLHVLLMRRAPAMSRAALAALPLL